MCSVCPQPTVREPLGNREHLDFIVRATSKVAGPPDVGIIDREKFAVLFSLYKAVNAEPRTRYNQQED